MTTKYNPTRSAIKVSQLAVKNARQAVSAASRGYTASARLHIQSAATFNQRAQEIDPGSPAAAKANAAYTAACARLITLATQRQEHDIATDYYRDEAHPETPQPQP